MYIIVGALLAYQIIRRCQIMEFSGIGWRHLRLIAFRLMIFWATGNLDSGSRGSPAINDIQQRCEKER
jgi:hypothetical protein